MNSRTIAFAVLLILGTTVLAAVGYFWPERHAPGQIAIIAIAPQLVRSVATNTPDVIYSYEWLPLNALKSHPLSNYSLSAADGLIQFKSNQGEVTISNANPSSFEVAVMKWGSSVTPLNYAKDQNHIYDFATEIIGADVNSFALLPYRNVATSPGYAKDKNYAYVMDYLLPLASTSVTAQQISISGADAATFEALYYISGEGGASESYARDKNHVYERSAIVEGADPQSITLVGNAFLKDRDSVFGDLMGE